MRFVLGAAAALVGMVVLGSLTGRPAPAGVASHPPAGSSWTVLSEATGDGGQQVVLFDSSARKMAVYLINSKGEIALKSVRTIAWDLQLDQFNSLRPLPEEIREMLPVP